MANTKDTKKSGSHDPMDSKSMGNQSGREFEGQGKNPIPGQGTSGQHAGGSKKNLEDDDMTSGGREGKFSDTASPDKGQWSPGSSQESDR